MMLNKNIKSILMVVVMVSTSLTACAKQIVSQPSDNQIREVVQNYIVTNVDNTAEIKNFTQNEILVDDEIYEVFVDAVYYGVQGVGQTALDITFSAAKTDWWVSKIMVRSIEEKSNTFDSQSQSIEDEVKYEDELSEEILAQLEKLSILAESASGKATLYYDRTEYEESSRASWSPDIYLLYDNTLEKMPDVAFSKYNEDEIEVECTDFDGDGKDEVAIVTVNCGGETYESDIRFIENPGTYKEHHYLYTEHFDDEDYYRFRIYDYEITDINLNFYDFIQEDVINDGSVVVIRNKNNSGELGNVVTNGLHLLWGGYVNFDITEDGFIVENSPILHDGYSPCEDVDLSINMRFKYLGDGKIALSKQYGVKNGYNFKR